MSKLRGAGPEGGPPQDSELSEFARPTPLSSVDAEFHAELRARLWELLLGLVARLRR